MNFVLRLILLSLLPGIALADERILSFESDITVMTDGAIEVVETITVRAEGNRIKRGIYRDLPTVYEDRFGNRHECRIEPKSLLRNSASEPFHTIDIDRGIRTYFGSKDRYLAHEVHTYVFRYRANRMLGFFAAHDELYWNVTGFEWAFPIDEARATVSFEFEPPMGEVGAEAYTGAFGEQGQDYTIERDAAARKVTFIATRPLSTVNGMTIVATWPKGFVDEPTRLDRFGWLVKDNLDLLIALCGLVLLLAYYIPAWKSWGRDPDEGPVVTRYEPPETYSPASLRYINQMYYDNKVMTAAIVNLAVKGYLRINHHNDKHSLTRLEPGSDAPSLAAGEKELYDALFAEGRAISLKQDNHEVLGKARSAHKQSLADDYKHRYFETNTWLNVPGLAIVLGTLVAALIAGDGPGLAAMIVVALMFVIGIFFAIHMKRPTMRGRQLLDELEGFRDYLDVAEKDELNLRNPPEKTPALFEKYLPYALALGVDQAWAEKFAAVLAAVRGPGDTGYQPGWYSGSWNTRSLLSSTSELSSGLNSAVSSSVTPPGSSSGSGGGGFSGGGGGGGGGGGW